MLTRSGAKKLKMNNQEASPSSSLSSGRNRKDRTKKIEDGQKDKKLEMLKKINSEIQIQDEAEKSINDLPPEMLMKILEHVDTKSLLNFRLVNRNCNVMAREILKSRTDLQVQFNSRRFSALYSLISIEATKLKRFIQYFGQSKSQNCVYFRFFFYEVSPSLFKDKDWIAFISGFGERIKGLRLKFKNGFDVLRNSVPSLGHLLLKQLPNLEELYLDTSLDLGYYKEVKLFPNSTAQLPHLKILLLDRSSLEKHTGIVTDLLCASINLRKIFFPGFTVGFQRVRRFEAHELKWLQSLGKIHCLEAAEILLDWDFLVNINPSAQSNSNSDPVSHLSRNFKLSELSLSIEPGCYGDRQSDTSVYLSNLFESSKDTLTRLSTRDLAHFPQVKIPVFNNLRTLCVKFTRFYENPSPILHSGYQFTNVFPALKSLELGISWSEAFTTGQIISSIPTLETLEILGELNPPYGRHVKVPIDEISFLCPNLKTFKISEGKDRLLRNFPEFGGDIWTHMKNLQSLELSIDADSPEHKFPAIDSCITGISGENSTRLFDLMTTAEKSTILRKGKILMKISEPELHVERQNVSILDLKDLKNLKISLFSESGSSSKLINTAITFLCRKYAFNFMDNFSYTIERNTIDLCDSDYW